MPTSATALAGRCNSICSVALHGVCPAVLQWTARPSQFQSRLSVAAPLPRLMSASSTVDLGPSSSTNVPVPAVRGVGLKQRLKATPSAELRTLIKRTTAYDKLLSQSQVAAAEELPTKDLSQWTRLSFRVVTPYARDDIVLQDAFAVVEAGPTQYKGTPRLENCSSRVA